jgi:hypothetical protein
MGVGLSIFFSLHMFLLLDGMFSDSNFACIIHSQ